MNAARPVRFATVRDSYALSVDKIALASKVLQHLQQNFDWPQVPEQFLFVKIPQQRLPKDSKPTFDVTKFYKLHRGVQGDLAEPETKLCSVIQEMLKLSANGVEFIDFIAKTFEQYVIKKKRSQYGGRAVYESANVEIRGGVVDYVQNYRTVDIGVDRIDDKSFVEMCECCLTVLGISIRKDTQIGFYAECFKQVREELGGGVRLRFELVAATTLGMRWSDLIITYLTNFKQRDVEVVGVSYWPEETHPFN